MKKNILAMVMLSAVSFSSLADTKNVVSALEADDWQAAERAFDILSIDEKKSVEGAVLAGRILLEKDESEKAFEHFETLAEQYADEVDVQYYLGVSAVIMAQKASVFSKLGYAKDFLSAMEKTIALKPDHLDALNTLIGFHLGAPSIAGGDTDKALVYAKQVQSFDEEQGYSQLVNVYWQTEQNELAEKALVEGLAKYPQSYQLHFTRASAHMKEQVWESAIADLTQAVKYAKDDEEKSRALYQLGKATAESGQEIELGIDALNQAMPLADDQYAPWVKFRLAQLYLHNNQIIKAQELIAAINFDEDDDLASKVKKFKKKLKKLMS